MNPLLARIVPSFLLSDETIDRHNAEVMEDLERQAGVVRKIRSMEPFCDAPQFSGTVVTIVEEPSRCTSCGGETHLIITIPASETERRNRICFECWATALKKVLDMPDEEVRR